MESEESEQHEDKNKGELTIIGTGHVFERSVIEVRKNIEEKVPDIVAVELDEKRLQALSERGLLDSDSPEFQERVMGTQEVLAQTVRGGSFLVLLQALLQRIQQELGRRYGVNPGADMAAAVRSSMKTGSRLALIDRNINITLNHLLSVPWREQLRLLKTDEAETEAMASLVGGDLEKLLDEENLEKLMNTLKKNTPYLFNALVDERDRYMALQLYHILNQHPDAKIVAVVGAGHKKGIEKYLDVLGEGGVISLNPLLKEKKTSTFSLFILIIGVVAAYVLTKVKAIGGR